MLASFESLRPICVQQPLVGNGGTQQLGHLRKRTARAWEDARYPRVLVRPVPDSHSHAGLNLIAGFDGGGVIFRLLVVVLVGFRVLCANI